MGDSRSYLSGGAADQLQSEQELGHRRVLLFLAQGFVDMEAAAVLDACGWTRCRALSTVVDVAVCGLHERVRGGFGSEHRVALGLSEVDPAEYDALVVPGGFHNLGYDEAYCEGLRGLVCALHEAGKPIATMCVGVLPVAESGAFRGTRATTFSFSSRHRNRDRLRELGCVPVDAPFVEDGGLLSCAGPAQSDRVAARLLEMLVGEEMAGRVQKFRRGI